MNRPSLRRFGLVLLYLLALPAGLASAWWTLQRAEALGNAVGPWRVSLLAGSADADAHTRARVALGGLLALNRNETMYYLARHDSLGVPLRSRCRYLVSGVPPRARWWSVTAYAEDYFLFPNSERRYSLNGATARLDAEGRFAFVSAPGMPAELQGRPWLPTPGDGGLMFTLRVYQPQASLRDTPQSLDAPRIEPLGDCR
jgi:hypothetical protein